MPDLHKNFSYSTVVTVPSPATSGTSLVVAAADGTKYPTPPFNATVWPASAMPLASNSEIVRVTAIATDTLTIVRAQEGTTARTIVVGDQIAATITAKTLTDVEGVIAQVFNVKTYGAKGDGTTNDTTSIQAAITAALVSGGKVYVPSGTYLISSALNIGGVVNGAGLIIEGAGWTSVIKLANGSNSYIFDMNATYTYGLIIRDLYLNANGTNQTATSGCISATGAIRCKFQNLGIDTPFKYGIVLNGNGVGGYGQHNVIENCLFISSSTSLVNQIGIYMTANDENIISNNTFQQMGAITSSYPMAVWDDAGLQTIINNQFVTGTGIRVGGGGSQTRVIGNQMDGSFSQNGQIYAGNSGVQIIGNQCYNVGYNQTSSGVGDGIVFDNTDHIICEGNAIYPITGLTAGTGIKISGNPSYLLCQGNSVTNSGSGLFTNFYSTPTNINIANSIFNNNIGQTTDYHTRQIAQYGGGVAINGLLTPTAPAITNFGTAGSTAYSYYVVAIDANGNKTLPSAVGTTTTGNTTLTAGNYNIVTWPAVQGAVSYDVLKGSTANSLALAVKTSINASTLSYNDIGGATSGYIAPSRNATADLTAGGLITAGTFSGDGTALTALVHLANAEIVTGQKTFQNAQTTFVGNALIEDNATATKAYRFRTSGGGLDFETGGSDLVISMWTAANFSGTQYNMLILHGGGGDIEIARNMVIDGNFYPDATTNNRTIGTSTRYWQNVYATRYNLNSTAYLDGGTAGTITVGGTLQIPTGAANGYYLKSDAAGNASWAAVTGGSGISRSVNNISTATTAGATAAADYVYFVTGTTTLTLPTAIGNTNRYSVVNNDASLTTTVATTSAQTINGSTTITLIPGQSVDLISNNANWSIF